MLCKICFTSKCSFEFCIYYLSVYGYTVQLEATWVRLFCVHKIIFVSPGKCITGKWEVINHVLYFGVNVLSQNF